MDLPGVQIRFATADTKQAPTRGRVLDHIGFDVKDHAAFVKRLEAEGIKLDEPVAQEPHRQHHHLHHRSRGGRASRSSSGADGAAGAVADREGHNTGLPRAGRRSSGMRWTSLGRHLLIGGYVIALATAAGAQDGTTPLHQAVRANDLKTVDALIKRGADVKAATRYGVTPMHVAALNGNAAILRRLLDAGADVNTATPGGETALMTAARTGNVDAVTLLLDRGANVNAKDTVRSQTALMWAVTENHPDIVKLLVARGADVKAQTTITTPKGEYVPARAGGASGNGIIRQRALPTKDGGMTPLLFAVRDGNVAMTRLLLELGADINQASGNHTSPLLIALLNGQVALATELLEQRRQPEPRRRLPARRAVRGDRAAQLQPREIPVPLRRRPRSARSDQGAAREGRRSQSAHRHDAGARADAVRRLVGELRRPDAVHPRGAVGRHRGDAPAAAARRRSEHRDDSRDRRR